MDEVRRPPPEGNRGMRHGGATGLLRLDDTSLQHIFAFLDPLPDLFNTSRSCRRLRDLSRGNWLHVVHHDTQDIPVFGARKQNRQQFTSLEAAIAASRPGDTILLEPTSLSSGGKSELKIPHHEAINLKIEHPLRLLGGGKRPEDCVVTAPASTQQTKAPVLRFFAAGLVSNLTVEGDINGCIARYRGHLQVENCVLRCDPRGLGHLAAPLWAKEVPMPSPRSSMGYDYCPPRTRGRPMISVSDTLCEGGNFAVRADVGQLACLHHVRVIYEDKGPLFWFEVHDGLTCPPECLQKDGRKPYPAFMPRVSYVGPERDPWQVSLKLDGAPEPERLQKLAAALVAVNRLLYSEGALPNPLSRLLASAPGVQRKDDAGESNGEVASPLGCHP